MIDLSKYQFNRQPAMTGGIGAPPSGQQPWIEPGDSQGIPSTSRQELLERYSPQVADALLRIRSGGGQSEGQGESQVGGGEPWEMPQEWQTAQDIYGQFAEGMPYAMPSMWTAGMKPLRGIMKTGMPVDVEALRGRLMPVAQRGLEEFTAQAMERADLGGTRWGTPLQATLGREAGRLSENINLQMAQAEIAAQEAARQRMLGGLGLGYQYGAGQFGLEQQMRQEQLAALPGLIETGKLPMWLSQQMMGLGQGLFGMQSTQQQQMLDDPYLMAMMGMAGQTGFAPQMYQPSPLTTGLDVFGSIAPWLVGRGGQQQQPSYQGTNVPYADYGLQGMPSNWQLPNIGAFPGAPY